MRDLNRAVGADAIRMREAAQRMADADELHGAAGHGRQWLVPALVDSVTQEPAGAYAAMEVLGFTDAAYSTGAVTKTLTAPPDPWIVRAALEACTRFVGRGVVPPARDGAVRRLALTLLRDETMTYTVRHQAPRLLALVALGDEQVARAINGFGDLDVRYAYLPPLAKAERRSMTGWSRWITRPDRTAAGWSRTSHWRCRR